MSRDIQISTILTTVFLGLFFVTTLGCPGFQNVCDNPTQKLVSGTFEATDVDRGEQSEDYPYNNDGRPMELTLDRDNETVEVTYTDEEGREVVETWTVDELGTEVYVQPADVGTGGSNDATSADGAASEVGPDTRG